MLWGIICTFVKISRSLRLRMRNVSDKSCTENQTTHFMFSNLFLPANRCVFEIMWKYIIERGRPHNNMAHAHCTLDN